MKITPKKEAIDKKLKLFFTGEPCKYGHISERYTTNGRCLSCAKKSYAENQESLRSMSQEEAHAFREKILARKARYRQKNKKSITQRDRKYKRENKKKIAEAAYERYSKNIEIEKAKRANYRKLEGPRKRSAEKYRQKYASNPEFRRAERMRRMLRRMARIKEVGEKKRAADSLMYTAKELQEHLERQFLRGMSWDNYGEWHIDHIRPVKKFIDEGETDPAVISALSNLRPMWASDNMSKGSKDVFLL